jgi:hypothetical protein
MSYKLLQPSTGESSARIAIRGPWNSVAESSQEIAVLRCWFEYDSRMEKQGSRRANWDAILGIALIAGLSVGFWAVVGLLVRHYWR